MNKKLLRHVLIASAVVGVAVGTLFTVKKVREMYVESKDKVQTSNVAYSKPEIQKKEASRKPIKVKLIADDDDDA